MIIRNLLKSLRIPCNVNNLITRQYVDNIPKALRSRKPKSTRETVQYYRDSYRIRAVAGNGGDGCISFLSVWCKEEAGPDGGDGGHGGHVIFQATHAVKSLNHCRKVIQADHGVRGDNKNRHGKNADHITIPVPLGTIVKDDSGCIVGELVEEGTMFVAARGGAGGRGNRFFLTDTEQAPSVAQLGGKGECLTYEVSMRARALAALVGAPSAGKSTLLRAVSRARPKAHAAPFTTRRPHIGMIPYDDYEQVALADLPGLIEGSHQNKGLGIQFLQHVERCHGFVYLLDGAADPVYQYEMLTNELYQYSDELLQRPHCIVVNKIDLPEVKENLEEVKGELEKIVQERGAVEYSVIGISAITGENLEEFLKIVRIMYDKAVCS